MKNRVPTKADRIEALKIERDNRLASLSRIMSRVSSVGWDKNSQEVAESHMKWLKEHSAEIRDFYKPATI